MLSTLYTVRQYHAYLSQVLAQKPSGPPRRRSVLELQEMHDCEDDIPALIIRGAWSIPAVMWRDIVKVPQRIWSMEVLILIEFDT